MELRKIDPMTCARCEVVCYDGLFVQPGKELRPGLFAVCTTCGTINVIGDDMRLAVSPLYYLEVFRRLMPESYQRTMAAQAAILGRIKSTPAPVAN